MSILDVDTVAAIYQGPLDNPPWQRVAEMLCDRMDAVMMRIAFRPMTESIPTIGVQAFRDSGLRVWTEFHSRFQGVATFDYALASSRRIMSFSDCAHVNPDAIARIRAELLDPWGVGDPYCLEVGEHLSLNTYLVWMKDCGKPITPDEEVWIKAVATHLAPAVQIYYESRQAQLACRLAGGALNGMSVGVLAIDRDDRIVFSNAIADTLLAASPDLGCRDNALVVGDAALRAKLSASRRESQVGRIRGPKEESISILMMPADSRDELGPASRPERAIYFHNLLPISTAPERLVADLYDLSVPEARLCALLVDGLTLRECSREMGITENTARTYSKHVFFKLGVSRQVDLVREMLRSLTMLGNGGSPTHLPSIW